MIISVTCRHGTQAHINRQEVGRDLLALARFVPAITRARVIFSKETHHKPSSDLVTCHISVEIPNRNSIDIYEQHMTGSQAFYNARERAVETITRRSQKHLYRQTQLFAEQWEQVS